MRAIVGCLFLGMLLLPGLANAAPSKGARAYLQFASRLFRDADYEGALLQLRRAEPMLVGHKKHALVLFNIARCHEELGQHVKAMRAYERFMEQPDTDARAARAQQKIAKLLPLATGQLSVRCDPAGTTLRIDGLDGSRRCPWKSPRMIAGVYVIHGTASGHEPRSIDARVLPGRVVSSRLNLPKIQAGKLVDGPPPPAKASPVPWVVAGAGVAVIGVGALLHLSAQETRDEANAAGSGSRFDALESSYRNRELAAFSAYAIGAGAVGLGTWWLTQPTK